MARKVLDKANIPLFECKLCSSTNTYTLVDGTKVCRKCGLRNTPLTFKVESVKIDESKK